MRRIRSWGLLVLWLAFGCGDVHLTAVPDPDPVEDPSDPDEPVDEPEDPPPPPPPPPPPVKITLSFEGDLDRPSVRYGASQSLPQILDASRDAAGNLWAVSRHRLHLLRAGARSFESFSSADGLRSSDLLSVSGGLAGSAWLGYRGLGDSNEDPLEWRQTGGVQVVELRGSGLRGQWYEIASPAGAFEKYPDGRHKVRTIWRVYAIKSGPLAGETWFGGNHGASMYGLKYGIEEHHHPTICLILTSPHLCTTKAGDVPAVAFTRDGGRWIGGTYGLTKIDYTEPNGWTEFWGPQPVRNLRVFRNPIRPNPYGSEDVTAIAVASDDSIWVSSRHSGLVHRLNDGTIESWRVDDGLPSNNIADLAMDADDGLWIAFSDAGLWRLDTTTGELRRAVGLAGSVGRRVVFEETALGPAVIAVVSGEIVVFDR